MVPPTSGSTEVLVVFEEVAVPAVPVEVVLSVEAAVPFEVEPPFEVDVPLPAETVLLVVVASELLLKSKAAQEAKSKGKRVIPTLITVFFFIRCLEGTPSGFLTLH